jgi:hypothetical protein
MPFARDMSLIGQHALNTVTSRSTRELRAGLPSLRPESGLHQRRYRTPDQIIRAHEQHTASAIPSQNWWECFDTPEPKPWGSCSAGRYYFSDRGGCACVNCSKGSFIPANVSWGQPWAGSSWVGTYTQYRYNLGYYQCNPCCLCNQDGYTTEAQASTSRDHCNVCLPGYGRHEELGGVPPRVCLPCPSGTYSGEQQ